MKTNEFLSLLNTHKEKALLFEYAPNLLVGANYHITEVKHVTVESVDCGAQTDSWKETIVQLWESPDELGKTEYMTVYKALSILKKVATMKTFVSDAELKIEYSNATFHTAQLFINGYTIKENNLIITLNVEQTACKANELCGITEIVEEPNASCSPSSGCC
ncbi:MAG: DUF6428 family protein [Flavobacteriaceae bacterium]